ncbi:MAG: slipin family protein [Limnochordaceae bacterium]|nr:slipin family protein [Limnochordaceae bacterium]
MVWTPSASAGGVSGVTILTVLYAAVIAWWVVWAGLAFFTKARAVLTFLLVSGLVWAGLGWPLSRTFWLIPYLAIPIIFLPSMVRIIPEYQRGVLFRFGRQVGLLGPGLNVVFPFGIDQVRRVDLRTFTIDVPRQEIITRDNVPVQVDAVVYFNVSNPVWAVIRVADYTTSTTLLGQTILRSVLGQHDLDDMLAKRAELNSILQRLLDEATDPWGIKVTAVEIKAMELPESMKRAMAKQAEAERERRAKVIAAEGELQASEKLAAAAKVIASEPATIQLRYLQTLTEIAAEHNSTILFPMPMELLRAFGKLGSGDANYGQEHPPVSDQGKG